MLKNLKNVLMAGLTATTFLTTFMAAPLARAESGGITASTDDSGRKIYVNDGLGSSGSASSTGRTKAVAGSASRSALGVSGTRSTGTGSTSGATGLMYWSSTEHRYKPVSTNGAMMRAARSAASEVNTYLGDKRSAQPYGHQTLNVGFTSADIDAAIDRAAEQHNVDPNLVRSVVKVESNFNPNAVSRKGAMGLMQLMPATARSLNVSNPFDPQQNVDAGVRHLKQLLENYGGDVRLTLAAYNAGAGAVARSAGIPRYAETQNYVRRITDLYAGGGGGTRVSFGVARAPVHVERDARGVLYISNTD
ncbi:MAG: lytic transglycosylase domain-containing protein [Terriglobales bacterium]